MRAIVSGPTAIVRSLLAVVPEDRLRDLIAQLLLDGLAPPAIESPTSAPAPAKRRAPPGKPGAPRKVAKTKANGAARTGASTRSEKERERRREYNRRYAAKRRAARAGKPAAPTIEAAGKPSGRAGRPQKANGGDGNNAPAVAPPAAITPQLFWDANRLLRGVSSRANSTSRRSLRGVAMPGRACRRASAR